MSCYYCSVIDGQPHLPECPKGGFVEAQANPPTIGALRPPTRDEVIAFERSKLPIEQWAAFDWHTAHRSHAGYNKAGTCVHVQEAS